MDFAILGGDARFACLARRLEQRGLDARRLWAGSTPEPPEALAGARNLVLNHPLRLRGGPDFATVLRLAPPDATLWLCGPRAPEAPPAGRNVMNLWADEQLLRENAALTAEGALSAAMRASRRSLREMPALVIGWGRIGRALTEDLVALGVPIAVASRGEDHRRQAQERGAEAVNTADIAACLPGRRLIFNTAPGRVLDAAALVRADAEAMLIDLASPPFGIDLSAAWARNLRAWREPGLPGRACPESAADALLRAMLRANEGRDRLWKA